MRHYPFFALFFILLAEVPATAFAQSRPKELLPQSTIFRNFMGYKKDKGEIEIEGEGYNIVITAYKMPPEENNYKKIANSLEGSHKVLKKELNNNPLENYVLGSSTKSTPAIIDHDYLYAGKNNDIIDVNVSGYKSQDKTIVAQVVASIFYDGIYDPMLIDPNNKMIDFIGQKVEFVDDCSWLRPHKIKCGKNATITWQLYNTLAEAEAARQSEISVAETYSINKSTDSAKVQVLFEGKEVTANKYKFDKNFMDITISGTKPVSIYYVAAEVRGNAVFCRLAFMEGETKVPFLISRIMRVK